MAEPKKCFYITWTTCYGNSGTDFVCAEIIQFSPGGGFCGGGAIVSREFGWNQQTFSVAVGSVTEVGLSNCRDCGGIKPDEPYDCVNGNCLPARTYNTPGKYKNIGDCQAGCIRDADCIYECIPTADIIELQQQARDLQAKKCK